jgi:hypothetical protein
MLSAGYYIPKIKARAIYSLLLIYANGFSGPFWGIISTQTQQSNKFLQAASSKPCTHANYSRREGRISARSASRESPSEATLQTNPTHMSTVSASLFQRNVRTDLGDQLS